MAGENEGYIPAQAKAPKEKKQKYCNKSKLISVKKKKKK